MNYTASKTIWDVSNPVPCIRVAFLSEFADGTLYADWEKWCEFCQSHRTEEWVFSFMGEIDYERTLDSANKYIIESFINWL